MKILFKNNTKYTKENYNAFIKFHQSKYTIKTIAKFLIILICIIYILIFNIIHNNWKVIIILLVLGILIYLIQQFKIDKQSKSNKKIIKDEKKFTFYFYKNYIKIKCGRKFDRISYLKLYKVFETNKYFFLYTDEEHSLIISKDGFEIGTPNEFTDFIKRKCIFKYKKESTS